MIKARNIQVSRGGNLILKNVSLTIRPGEVVAVVGANGAGKSTLLQAMSKSLTVSSGLISLNGIALEDWETTNLARVRGILSQQINLSFCLPVIEVVNLGRHPHAQLLSRTENEAIAWHCLQQVGMQDFAYRNIQTLSGGEQQRVHFARVLAQINESHSAQAKYLLLDEPTSSLDLYQQHQLLQLVREQSKSSQIGIFIILHDLNLAAQYADHLVLLKNGSVIEQGTPAEVLTEQNILAGFNMQTEIVRKPCHNHLHISVVPQVQQKIYY